MILGHRLSSRMGVVLVAGSCLLIGLVVGPRAQAAQGVEGVDISPEALLADQLVILARQSVEGAQDPGPDQLTRAAVLLDLALGLQADDAELWRLRAELAGRMDNRDDQLLALKRYCSLRPDDDAAQLEWIMAAVGVNQTIEQRLEAVEKILNGKKSQKLSEPLRSRLASYVASVARETGDADRMIRRLKDAIRLDRSNQEAAAMTLEWLVAAGAPPATVGEALMHLVLTHPTNGVYRRQLAKLLLSQGAYVPAAQQYEAAHRLTSGPDDGGLIYNWALSLAASGHIDDGLNLLTQHEISLEPAAVARPVDEDQATDPVAVTAAGLPLDMELLRLTLLSLSGRQTRADGSFHRIGMVLRERLPRGDPQAESDLIWLGLLFRQAVPDSRRLGQLAAGRPENDPFIARVTGWVHLQAGDRVATRRALAAHVNVDPFSAYGMARALDQDDQRLQQLQEVVDMAPDNLAGLMAAHDLVTAGAQVQPTADGARLTQLIDVWPKKVATPDPDQDRWTALTMTVQPTQFVYFQPITARLTLHNTSDFPLSIGPGQPVPARMLIYLSMRQAGAALGDLPPIVVDVQRLLSLPPRESLRLDMRLDRGSLGSVLSSSPGESIGFDVTAVLGPRLALDGRLSTQPMGATDAVYLIERRGQAVTEQLIDRWITLLHDTDPVRQMLASARLLRSAAILDRAQESSEIVAEKIAYAVNLRYDQLTPISQAWAIRFLPRREESTIAFDAVHESAQRSMDRAVQIIYAATQIKNPKSTVINTMLRHPDPQVVAFAKALRVGLQATTRDEDTGEGEAPATGADLSTTDPR